MQQTARIKVLSEDVKSRISAGEVIEGPSSVIKELIENALDAGALNLDIQVLQGGMKKILVSDDGFGIPREDVLLAVKDHATSKISDVRDIESISTYGFRGEALACIAAVSQLTILTRHSGEEMGSRLICSGEDVKIGGFAGPVGTTVIVENLFYNVPARKKFLKAPQTELRYCRNVFLNAALANPGAAFSMSTGQKHRQNLPSAESVEERLRQIYGDETFENCYFERLSDVQAQIYGMVSKPNFLTASRAMQQLFINGRPVDYKYLSFILSKGYEAAASKGRYPAAVLFLDIAPELVDVNVHPAKREVKLFDGRYVDSLIIQLVKKALNKVHGIDAGLLRPEENNSASRTAYASSYEAGNNIVSDMSDVYNLPLKPQAYAPSLRELEQFYTAVTKPRDYLVLGEIFETYILVLKESELYIIDFHAAHERFIYDELKKKDAPREKQELLFPVALDLPSDAFYVIADNMELFLEIGFDIDEFPENTITVRAVPAVIGRLNERAFMLEAAELIKQNRNPDLIYEQIAATAACHAAGRAGDTMSPKDMELLTEKVFSGRYELRCPHGRPFVHVMRKQDLERIFKRS